MLAESALNTLKNNLSIVGYLVLLFSDLAQFFLCLYVSTIYYTCHFSYLTIYSIICKILQIRLKELVIILVNLELDPVDQVLTKNPTNP